MSEPNDVKSIFLTAVEKEPPAERNAYLDGACGDDVQLRQRVEALLRAHDNPDSALEKPAAGVDRNIYAGTLPMPRVTEVPAA